jgi:LPXTG-motif cell wall-anchored protein
MNITKLVRSKRVAVTVAAAAAMTMAIGAPGAASAYPPQPPDRSISFASIGPDCENVTPVVRYAIETEGFESDGPVTFTVTDVAGQGYQETIVADGLTGWFVYPGASLDPLDYPGWKQVDGQWVEDDSDAYLRLGLNVVAEVNPTATAVVNYPPFDSVCADPELTGSATPQVPSQASGSLPATGGSGTTQFLWLAGAAVAAGVAVVVASKRRGDELAEA